MLGFQDTLKLVEHFIVVEPVSLFDYLNTGAEIIGAFALFMASLATCRGLKVWKKKIDYERNLEFGENLIAQLMKFKTALLTARRKRPSLPYGSTEDRDSSAFAEYVDRIEALAANLSEISGLGILANARWEDFDNSRIETLGLSINRLNSTIMAWHHSMRMPSYKDEWAKADLSDIFIPYDDLERFKEEKNGTRVSKFASEFENKVDAIIDDIRARLKSTSQS